MAEPRCPYFGNCGGCTAQHIDYPLQLENKKKALACMINHSNIKVFSGNDYSYRNRMDFVFHPRGIGFRRKGDWKSVIDIDSCIISNQQLNIILKEARDFFTDADSFDSKRHTGTFRYAVIRTPSVDSSISFVLNSGSARLQEAVERVKSFAGKTSAHNVVIAYISADHDDSISSEYFVVKGKDTLRETLLGKGFIYPVQGFFQNNHEIAGKMHEHCRNLLSRYKTRDAHLLDLYGGVGTFGINNADLFSKVTIVEGVKEAIDCANQNIKANSIVNAEALVLDDRQFSRLKPGKPLYIITDPPRSGMNPKAIQQLNRFEPDVIIYISCNPQQLGKDIPKFREYKIKSAAMFDMFPQTNHCEAIVELVRKDSKD